MNTTRLAANAVRDVMRKLVPPTGAKLTPQLTYRIKRDTLALMKAQGCDLTEHKRQIKLEFINGQPNLIVPLDVLHPTAH